MIRWDHLLALSLIGVAGLVLILQGDRQDGIYLMLVLAGYAFGVTANGVSNHLGTSASKPIVASTANLTSPSNGSTDSDFLELSPSIWTLADEAYEDDG